MNNHFPQYAIGGTAYLTPPPSWSWKWRDIICWCLVSSLLRRMPLTYWAVLNDVEVVGCHPKFFNSPIERRDLCRSPWIWALGQVGEHCQTPCLRKLWDCQLPPHLFGTLVLRAQPPNGEEAQAAHGEGSQRGTSTASPPASWVCHFRSGSPAPEELS